MRKLYHVTVRTDYDVCVVAEDEKTARRVALDNYYHLDTEAYADHVCEISDPNLLPDGWEESEPFVRYADEPVTITCLEFLEQQAAEARLKAEDARLDAAQAKLAFGDAEKV